MEALIAPDICFGLCPECRQLPELITSGAEEYAACHVDKIKWHFCTYVDGVPPVIGDAARISDYREVEPYFDDDSDAGAEQLEKKDMHASMKARRINGDMQRSRPGRRNNYA